MGRTREKSHGRLGVKRSERYALMPDEVMRSASWAALPDFGKPVLFALLCQYNGRNNGNLSLPFSEARALGISAQWKLYAGLRLCEWTDLIVCSRRGKLDRGTKLPSLFALTWRGVDDTGIAYDHGTAVCPIASHAWVRWQKPDDWQKRVQTVQRQMRGGSRYSTEIAHTPLSGNGRSSLSGNGKADIAPHCQEEEAPFIAPHCQETSKTLGRGAGIGPISPAPVLTSTSGLRKRSTRSSLARERGAAMSAPTVTVTPAPTLSHASVSKLMTMMLRDPDKTDRDLAVIFKCEHTEVALVRERIRRLS